VWQRFTKRARLLVFFAQEEAGRRDEKGVSTAHLLLGLTRENDSVAARLLAGMGVSLDGIRIEIGRQAVKEEVRADLELQELTQQARHAIDLAYDEARQLRNHYIGTEHLLLGLIREPRGAAGRVLAHLGIKLEQVRHALAELQKNELLLRPAGLTDAPLDELLRPVVDGDEWNTHQLLRPHPSEEKGL
jgi:ATP-dependent Clp protease ATP-binding subunit ClpC